VAPEHRCADDLRRDLHLGRQGVRPSPRAPRRPGDLGTDGTALRGPRRAPSDGVPALRDGSTSKVTTGKPRGLEELDDLDVVFRALAHTSRRTILVVLHARGGEMTAGAIASRFECSWPTITRHLRELEQAGLVSTEPRGRERIYRLEPDRLRAVAGLW